MTVRSGKKAAGLGAGMVAVALAWGLAAEARGGGVEWGGILPEGRSQNLRFQAGAVGEFEGVVSETTRKLYEVTGATESQALADTLGTSDLDLEGPFAALGFSLGMDWRFVRLSLDTTFMNPSVSTTAKRDYYVGVGDSISYGGASYDNLMIPEGSAFSAEVMGGMADLLVSFVPLGFRLGEGVVINPSLGAGLVAFGGRYEVDAGESTGVVPYQNPPEDFVVGGKTSGFIGMGSPQWGPGVEVRLGRPGGVVFDLEAHYLMFDFDGNTAFFTTADHREKNLDFEHSNVRLRGQVEFPTRRGAWSVGVVAQFLDSEGLVSSSATDPAEILAKRERFDKEFSFRVRSVMATIGLVF